MAKGKSSARLGTLGPEAGGSGPQDSVLDVRNGFKSVRLGIGVVGGYSGH